MTWTTFLDSTFRHDIEIPRRQIPWAIFAMTLAMTVTLVAGLYFGSRAADDDRAAERDAIMKDFALQLAAKDDQIARLTGQMLAMQQTSLARAESTNATLESIVLILNELATGAKLNKEAAQRLSEAVAKTKPQAVRITVAPAAPQAVAPRRTLQRPPLQRPPMAMPPKKHPTPAAGDMPIGGPQ